MKFASQPVLWALTILLPALLACSVSQAPKNRAAAPAPHSEVKPLSQAESWLGALSVQSFKQLRDRTSFPFELRDTEATYECPRSVSEGPLNLDGVLSCLIQDELFFSAFLEQSSVKSFGVIGAQLPSWAKQWESQIEDGDVPVFFNLISDAITFQFILLASENGIREFWKHGEFHPDP